MNDRIDTVFDYDMSNDIADILIDEINNIIQTIAPKTTFSILDQTIKLTSNDRCLTRRISLLDQGTVSSGVTPLRLP